ncbi:MAG: hypothetical protein ABF633_15695 [Clostridium sp.]|uniref:hypothetical protein n=1 Tax=Clostridium sp. TaxID=1506 RepID=UPI0039EAFF3F
MEKIKTVDLYLASSIGESIGTFSALLVYQNNSKIVYGTYDDMKLIEALLLGLSESLKLLKEKCSVRVNLLSNNVIRALMKKKANISDKIINSALEQVNKHNIEFIIVKEDDKNRIILDRVKRKSKEISSNKIKNKQFIEHADYEYYSRPKKVVIYKYQNSLIGVDNFSYLDGITNDTHDWIIQISNNFGLNLYNSVAATINANISKKTLDEIINNYIEKNKNNRTYIRDNEEKITEIFKYVYYRLKNKRHN